VPCDGQIFKRATVQADAKERFMECKVAYQTLSDATQRAKFDRQQVSRGSTAPTVSEM